MITDETQLPCLPPEGARPEKSRVRPRVRLAMPDDHDDMSAPADMSAVGSRPGPIAIPSFCTPLAPRQRVAAEGSPTR